MKKIFKLVLGVLVVIMFWGLMELNNNLYEDGVNKCSQNYDRAYCEGVMR